ncbi:MAG TPA: PP2C family protein-serine/threonine phosphatase [Roseiflexaceae bacterium]|nr:PP2C family protein-serine/threonine phosphatase [Roseiflexaceae bacterium]
MHTTRSHMRRRGARGTLMGHVGRAPLRPRPRRAAPPPAEPQVSQEELRRQAEIERELLLARDIQQGLLLEAVPRLAGWEISAVSLPARDLGGDLYDFLPLGDGWQGIMIGDVSGKGLPAALRMAVARTVFRHEARRGHAPGHTLAAVNRGVISEIPQGMITMLYAMLDTRAGVLRLANAGHNYPVVINGRVCELELTGLPLGVDGDSDYEEVSTVLGPGDTVLLYTDGVVEATNHAEEYFGFERLARLLSERPNMKPRALMQALLHELRTWSASGQADDITVVVLRRRLERLDAELRSIADDVLGPERAAQLWAGLDLPSADAPADAWAEALPEVIRVVQGRFGRGLARELNGQLRLALEEYR